MNTNSKSASLSKIPKRNINDKTVYNNSDIIQLKSKLGINTIMNTLSDAVYGLITNIDTRNKSNQNVPSKDKPTSTVTRKVDSNIIPLECNFSCPSHNYLDLDLLSDAEPYLTLHRKFTQDNPVEYESATSYDPNDLLDRVLYNIDQSGNANDKWDLSQLDTDAKTGPKVLNNLAAAAVKAAIFKRSMKD